MGRVSIGEFGIHEMYKYYKSTRKDPVDYKTYKAICEEYAKICANKIIEESVHLRFPFVGILRIKKTKQQYKTLKFDFQTYRETGIKAYHLNEHSDDFYAKWFWHKSNCRLPGKLPYSFTATRDNKRHLAKVMKSPGGHNRYYE